MIPESAYPGLVCEGPTVRDVFADGGKELTRLLRDHGYRHTDHYAAHARLPMHLAAVVDGVFEDMGPGDRILTKGGRSGLPPTLLVDREFAWLLGIYAAEGYRRRQQFVVSNTDQAILDRVEAVLHGLGLPTTARRGRSRARRRSPPACSSGSARAARPPRSASHRSSSPGRRSCSSPSSKDSSTATAAWRRPARRSGPPRRGSSPICSSCSPRLGRRAGTSWRDRGHAPICQVYAPTNEHKLLTGVPLPDELLVGPA